MLDTVIMFLAVGALAFFFMILTGFVIGFLLAYRFSDHVARLLAIGLTAAIFLPILVPGTMTYGLAGFGLIMIVMLFLPASRQG